MKLNVKIENFFIMHEGSGGGAELFVQKMFDVTIDIKECFSPNKIICLDFFYCLIIFDCLFPA